MKVNLDTGICFVLMLIFATGFYVAWQWPYDPSTFPLLICGTGFVLAGIRGAQSLILLNSQPQFVRDSAGEREARIRQTATLAWIIAFFAGSWIFGFYWGLPAMVFLYHRFEAGLGWIACALFAGATGFGIWLVNHYLHLPFPTGIFFDLF